MDVKEFLLTDKLINKAELARRMWPAIANPTSKLNSKLKGKDNKKFSRKDALLAQQVLKQMGDQFSNLTVADSY